jgi:hypothetical protein
MMTQMSGKADSMFWTKIRKLYLNAQDASCFEMLQGRLEDRTEMIYFGHSRYMYEKVEYTRS